MRVLFLGFGDIARRAAPLFVAAGWQVTGVRRSADSFPGVRTIAGDCRDRALLQTLVAEHDLVVASLSPDDYSEQGYRDGYVAPAEAIRDSINSVTARPRLLLWVSSTGVYGQGNGDWVDETAAAAPGNFSGQYLLQAERIVAEAQCPSAAIRFSGIYGPGRERLINLVKAGRGVPAEPLQWSNRIHADDCAGVIFHLAQYALAGNSLAPVVIATDCEPLPLHQVYEWLAEQLGVRLDNFNAPSMRGNRRCANRLLLSTGYRFIYPTFRDGYRQLLDSSASADRCG